MNRCFYPGACLFYQKEALMKSFFSCIEQQNQH